MILSASEIIRRMEHETGAGKLVITPYQCECQQPASYDLRAASDIPLTQGKCTLVPTLEWVEIPKDLAGTLRCRSSFGRKGVLLGAGFVDPGFRGQLTLCLINMEDTMIVRKNDRIVQLILHEVRGDGVGYSGRYQDSIGAVGAREL